MFQYENLLFRTLTFYLKSKASLCQKTVCSRGLGVIGVMFTNEGKIEREMETQIGAMLE